MAPIATSRLTATVTVLVLVGVIAMSAHSGEAAFGRRRPPPPLPSEAPPEGDEPIGAPPSVVKETFINLFHFIKDCAIYMHITSPRFFKPNDKCCMSIAKVNVPRFCKIFFIPNTEKVFSPRKVARTAQHCKVPLNVGTWCGTYKVRKNPLSIEDEEQ